MASTLNFTSESFIRVTQFTPTDTTTTKDILPADALLERRIYGITIYTDESTSRDVKLYLSDGSSTWQLTTISIPVNSGNTNAIVPVDAFSSTQMSPYIRNRDASGASYIHIPKNWSIRASWGVTITSARVANVIVIGETY